MHHYGITVVMEGNAMTNRDQTPVHNGRLILREVGKGRTRVIGVLCPLGHVVTSMPARDWAGSWLEAKAGDPSWTVTCEGALA